MQQLSFTLTWYGDLQASAIQPARQYILFESDDSIF